MTNPTHSAAVTSICNGSELSFGNLKAIGLPAIIVALGLFALCLKRSAPNKPLAA